MRNNHWSLFEYKAALCFTPYKDRYLELRKELDRVGLTDVNIQWDTVNPFKEVLLRNVPMTPFNKRNGCFYIGLNNYRAIKTAYGLGCKSVLVMEDDVRFLRDENLLAEVLEDLPKDYDLAMLDYNKPTKMDLEFFYGLKDKDVVSKYWRRFPRLTSSGCYAMSRRGMERWLKCYERPLHVRGVQLHNNDHYFDRDQIGWDLNLYACYPHVAVQVVTGKNGSHCDLNPYWERNAHLGMTKEMYGGEKDMVGIVCVAKDEDNYINEWLTYHIALGVDRIFVIQNGGWRYHGIYEKDPHVVWLVNDDPMDCNTNQSDMYNKVIRERHVGLDWIFAIDADEFIVVKDKSKTFKKVLSENRNNNTLFFHWRIFGDNGLRESDGREYSVLKRFTKCAKEVHANGKSGINLARVGTDYLRFRTPHDVAMITGKIERNESSDCEIFHYRNKTYAERMARNSTTITVLDQKVLDEQFARYNKNEVVNTEARDFLYGIK